MFCLRARWIGPLLGLLLLAGCSGSQSGTTSTGNASAGGTNAGGGVNAVATVGTGGSANGSTAGASGGSVSGAPGGSTTGAPGGAVSGVAGGIGNPTRPPAPVPGASPTSLAAQTITVSMTSANQFNPATIDVPRGATVVWTNSSQTNHTVTGDPAKAANASEAALPQGAQTWDSGPVGPGSTFTHIFDTPGSYTYFCTIHGEQGMVAHITVSS
jgi:plastocyanin